MRKRMTSAFVAVTFGLLIGVTVRADDQQIGKQIVDRLQAQRQTAQLEGFNIGVQVESGTVTMSGSVSRRGHGLLASSQVSRFSTSPGDAVFWAMAGWNEATSERAASQRLAREKRVIWITPQILRLREMMVGSGSKRRKRLVFKRG